MVRGGAARGRRSRDGAVVWTTTGRHHGHVARKQDGPRIQRAPHPPLRPRGACAGCVAPRRRRAAGGVRTRVMERLDPPPTVWGRFRGAVRRLRGRGIRRQAPENPTGRDPRPVGIGDALAGFRLTSARRRFGIIMSAERRAPSAERRAPSAERRAPSAERRAPSAERRAPSAKAIPWPVSRVMGAPPSPPPPTESGFRRPFRATSLLLVGFALLTGFAPGAAEAQTAQTVPSNWALIPDDTNGNDLFTSGQSFRLLFLTSGTTDGLIKRHRHLQHVRPERRQRHERGRHHQGFPRRVPGADVDPGFHRATHCLRPRPRQRRDDLHRYRTRACPSTG